MNNRKPTGAVMFAIAGACLALSASGASAQESGKDPLKYD
jgi:hypothetical protein